MKVVSCEYDLDDELVEVPDQIDHFSGAVKVRKQYQTVALVEATIRLESDETDVVLEDGPYALIDEITDALFEAIDSPSFLPELDLHEEVTEGQGIVHVQGYGPEPF